MTRTQEPASEATLQYKNELLDMFCRDSWGPDDLAQPKHVVLRDPWDIGSCEVTGGVRVGQDLARKEDRRELILWEKVTRLR